MFVCIYKVVDGEKFFAIKQAGTTPNNLFKLNHGIYRAKQNNIAYVPGVYSGRKFLGSGQNGWDVFSLS
jgi:hypothetical protein